MDSRRVDKHEENRAKLKERKLLYFSRFQQDIGELFQMFQARRKQKGPMARSLFRNAHILDAERGNYLADSSVLVEGDRILEVGGAEVHASDAQSFDLHGMTLMPGLIDAHVHVTAVTADLAQLAEWSAAYVRYSV